MSTFYSSYDTTFGKKLIHDSSINAILKASNYFNNNDSSIVIIDGKEDIPVDIPTFNHPLTIVNGKDNKIYIDVRPFVNVNRVTGVEKNTSPAEYAMLYNRAVLECSLRENPNLLSNVLGVYPAGIFGSWISENISKRYGLQMEDQYKLQIYAVFYYYSLFEHQDDAPDEQDYLKICKKVSECTGINVNTIFTILDNKPFVNNIEDFCSHLEDVTNNIRLKGFNATVLYPLLKATWYGHNANEVVAVAMEHIPTFIAMLYAAINERSFKRSAFAKMTEYNYVKKLKDNFTLIVTDLTKAQ